MHSRSLRRRLSNYVTLIGWYDVGNLKGYMLMIQVLSHQYDTMVGSNSKHIIQNNFKFGHS